MKQARGFTLIELAIVLVLMTILIGGLAVPLSAQIQARRVAETRAEMNATRDALLGYAMSHACRIQCDTAGNACLNATPASDLCQKACDDYCGTRAAGSPTDISRPYFPCPDADGNGREDRDDASGECVSAAASGRGALPWLTLGVKGHDAWGNRFTYAVSPAFSEQVGIVTNPPTTASVDVLSAIPATAPCGAAPVAENVPLLIVSHGPNGRGATNMGGGTPTAATSVPAAERQNLAIATASLPCASATSFAQPGASESFDDLVTWISAGEIFNRLCPSGGCP